MDILRSGLHVMFMTGGWLEKTFFAQTNGSLSAYHSDLLSRRVSAIGVNQLVVQEPKLVSNNCIKPESSSLNI
ncbi:unnamed protein product [Enterobius vermicularis]|uniref:Uncharacterized protein n=1 Tax=Enterobius vermicularis TaxID=51028 RepID=A0A0N4VCE3_ENTVE|nr:unnamed protein product [Enterobius vermicularis]